MVDGLLGDACNASHDCTVDWHLLLGFTNYDTHELDVEKVPGMDEFASFFDSYLTDRSSW